MTEDLTERHKVNLDVPYYSQTEETALSKYGTKACGLTSLRMVLAFYGQTFNINQMEQLANRVGAYDENARWTHAGLVNIARDAGLMGFRINYSMLSDEDIDNACEIFAIEGGVRKEIHEEIDNFRENVEFAREQGDLASINSLLENQIPIIASMKKSYADTADTHLVVIRGRENNNYIINDPWHNGASYTMPVENFNEQWTKRAIVIYKKGML
ncbi:hypothetical protein A2617_02155 [Candidatus Daviesbacteria bacterium RIFOXYD1_FULL_41_10]|uniref:Peptidase C39 domain-containing protein n=1 Tax=Candidatus Daviesbacteria bacterium RIFOXYD1_FULL_41_10 TaxID=1797801 RepID=A0A1F5N2C7_9BACT|nr:MAG: hypothetical protein A2617_02155 [Candidatus Daviesbacteria bacterium RIFOXYD1_FULL_41_10]